MRWCWVNFQCRGVLQSRAGSWVRYPVWQHTFVSPYAFSRRAVVSYWRKYVHEVLVNRLGGLSLPRKSVVRLNDRPDMTLDVYSGRKTTMQQQHPTILITVGQGPIALAVGAGGVVWTFLLSSFLSPLSPSLWETARYRMKYCLKGPLNPKQPTFRTAQSDQSIRCALCE